MDKTISVYCNNIGRHIEIKGGQNLLDIYNLIKSELNFTPICATVNNKVAELTFNVYSPKNIQFLPRESRAGTRTYIRSLCMMLYHAINHIIPGARLRIEHSLSGGYFCRITGVQIDSPAALADDITRHILALVSRDLPFLRHEKNTTDVIEIFRRQGLDDKVTLLQSLHNLYTAYNELDGLCDSYYGPLAPSTAYIPVFRFIPYKDGFLLLGCSDSGTDSAPRQPVPQDKMYRAFTDYLAFNRIVGVKNVGELNTAVEKGQTPMLINVAEALHNNRIAAIADDIAHRYREGGARIILIAGPSSSGKTTFTKRLAIQLMTCLLNPQLISLDDYFVDREKSPRDENGDFDYESIHALDLTAFNRDLNNLIDGQEVELPYYNFEIGRREYRGNIIRLRENSILLIEGIHGLNPELTASVPERMKYRVYVSALTSISIDDHNWIPTTDNRLLRRIIRDNKYRGTSPAETIRRWPSVRRGEERWIFPFQENADAMFNSSLLFELGVMKNHAVPLLSGVPHDSEQYSEAARLLTFLSYFATIPENFIPSTSLLREFLGGSSFKY